MVQPKNREVPFNSGTLVFTSNVDPKDWYAGYGEGPEDKNKVQKKQHKDALERRIQDFAEIYDCTKERIPTPRGPAWIYMQEKRTETFKFRTDNYDFSNSSEAQDQPGGNGFMRNGYY